MARLKLKQNKSLKDVGRGVLVAAQADALGNAAAKQSAQNEITAMLEDLGGATVNYVYDTPTQINVVVPFIGNKMVRSAEAMADENQFELDEFAAEAMGFIVIFGCGK